jgi:limonene-1,2-epoxide hydrolase
VLSRYPELLDANESSILVLFTAANAGAALGDRTDMVSLWSRGDIEQQSWIRGVVDVQDDFCHEIFSWNDPKDKPMTHQGLRPPLFRKYGQPNRG